jgi:UDP-N-acetylglucosamine acyltransferase
VSVIHPTAIVEDGAEIGEGVEIGPYAFVGRDVTLADGVRLFHHASVIGKTRIGAGCEVHPFALIGGAPQVLGLPDGIYPVEIGQNCTFREHVTIHAGSPHGRGITKIGDGCFFMVGTHVAHDGLVGNKCVFANNAIVAGQVTLGDQVWLGGHTAVHQFVRIGDHGFTAGGAILVDDLVPFGAAIGNHAELAGVNVNGLKRRGFSRSDMAEIRKVYAEIFEGEGTFSERLQEMQARHADRPLARQILDFAAAEAKRPLCRPRQRR